MQLVIFIKLIGESFRFAVQALRMNMLRTVLSLLGVTVGIFAIIGVFTVVDSLEKNIKESLNFLGSDLIYVDKWPWVPEGDGEYEWWHFWRRPHPSINEYKFLSENSSQATAMTIMANRGGLTFKRGSNSIKDATLQGASFGYQEIYDLEIEEGRFFSRIEVETGRNVCVIGANVADNLFPRGGDILGEEIKVKNTKYVVIGVIKREGESFLDTPSDDDIVVVPYGSFRKLYLTGTGSWRETGSMIILKGREDDIGLVELENEVRGHMRRLRGLKPKDRDNFAMNRPEAISNVIGGVFDVLTIAGWIIGSFSILVGGFGIANIMFVSVRERTNIIGIQKSLGAKNYFVLFQFLFESVFLSLVGGLVGLLLVYLLSFVNLGTLTLSLSFNNIVLGLGVAMAVGSIAGIIPAALAARMDPVIAIRSK